MLPEQELGFHSSVFNSYRSLTFDNNIIALDRHAEHFTHHELTTSASTPPAAGKSHLLLVLLGELVRVKGGRPGQVCVWIPACAGRAL